MTDLSDDQRVGEPRMSDLACTRRTLLRGAGAAGVTAFVSSLAGVGLSAIDALPADAATAGSYKALVCVFLFGGNDGMNVVVPTEASAYAAYARARGNLAVARSALLPLAAAGAPELGFHPQLAPLASLFQQGHLGVVTNVGSLLAPTAKADFKAGRNLPGALFSHSDQQTEWMVGSSAGAANGWGGRLADLLTPAGHSGLSMNISVAGTNIFETGRTVVPYSVASNGGVHFNALDNAGRAALIADNWARVGASADPLQGFLGQRYAEARSVSDHLTSVLRTAPSLSTAFPTSSVGRQLANVAKLIHARRALGAQRQIFFVAMGGFDTHAGQAAAQPRLFADLAASLSAFHAATVEMGVAEQVTSFTHSDFGRTLTSNGSGSDHAWGSHHLVVGGAVRGGVYGAMPELALGSALEVGGGRFIPTTPVDAYASTLARWFGARADDVHTLFPRLSRFAHPNLGFLAPAKAAAKR